MKNVERKAKQGQKHDAFLIKYVKGITILISTLGSDASVIILEGNANKLLRMIKRMLKDMHMRKRMKFQTL